MKHSSVEQSVIIQSLTAVKNYEESSNCTNQIDVNDVA